MSLLPMIKCSSCGVDIEILQLADHVCVTASPSGKSTRSPVIVLCSSCQLQQFPHPPRRFRQSLSALRLSEDHHSATGRTVRRHLGACLLLLESTQMQRVSDATAYSRFCANLCRQTVSSTELRPITYERLQRSKKRCSIINAGTTEISIQNEPERNNANHANQGTSFARSPFQYGLCLPTLPQ